MESEKDNPLETPTYLTEQEGKRQNLGRIIVFVIIGLLVVGGAVFAFNRFRGASPTVSPSPSPFVTPEISPSPEPELKREDLTLQVLNGSGTPGAAGTAREYLEGLGYNVAAVGNAETFDFQETLIRIKDRRRDYLELLRPDLEEEYEVGDAETLDEDSEYDAVIVIGGPGPTPSPSPKASPSPSPTATPSASPSS